MIFKCSLKGKQSIRFLFKKKDFFSTGNQGSY